MSRAAQRDLAFRPALDPPRALSALDRLAREKALHSLVRWALPVSVLKPLLADAMPRRLARDLPPETWAGLAVTVARDVQPFALLVAEALHDRLGWDREPSTIEELERLCRERPLEGLWVGALAEAKPHRKAYPRLAAECLRRYRSSPDCPPASWDYVETLMQIHADTLREMERVREEGERAARERDAERQRLDTLRDELKRLRRENAELRAEKAAVARKVEELAQHARTAARHDERQRIEDLERRLRKAEKEREHLSRELDRRGAEPAPVRDPVVVLPPSAEPAPPQTAAPTTDVTFPPVHEDPIPRRRALRQMLRKLVKKGKIGASHTHEDNVHRGVAHHDKGDAKQAIELLAAEGYLVRKSSLSEPHVSINPERIVEVRAIIAGDVRNPRLLRFVEGKEVR